MPYASQQDMIDRYGEDALLIAADRDHDGVIDTDVVSTALQDATDEIDAYVGKKYSLPLPSVPGVLQRICIDIALYRLTDSTGYTEERRQRYDDDLAFLLRLSKGDISLGMPENQEPESSAGDVEFIANTRLFTRNSMNRLT